MAIRSMTGFGSAAGENDFISVRAEVKALNGKFLEINARLPKSYQSKELELRKLLQSKMERGTVQVFFNIENKSVNTGQYKINKELARFYYDEITELGFELGANVNEALMRIMEFPDVLSVVEEDERLEENWNLIYSTCEKAIDNLKQFREEEGMALGKAMEQCVLTIRNQVDKVISLEPQRLDTIRERIANNLEEFIGVENIDRNRFEQELIYFLEKMDIAEEKTRLLQHCQFFLDNLYKDSGGKKLGFIAQEMGREINTMGAKAYHFGIQQSVVTMKEELEKIKEQVLNIL
ncbi:MAG: YicC family protein [Bacteroidetes bacterium]|nr:MAG: YicC family protein [Bacteroidota bacterium]